MNYLDLAWSKLDSPFYLAMVVELLMFFILKPVISRAFEKSWERWHIGYDYPSPWVDRDIAITLSTFVTSWVIAVLRVPDGGTIFILGLVAGTIATGGYEGIKNVLRTFGVDIAKFNWR